MVEHSSIDKYVIRDEKNQWIGNILLDNVGGDICIISEWGQYSFAWRQLAGEPLKKFLIGCDFSYLCGKFMSTYYSAGVSRTQCDKIEKRLLIFLAKAFPLFKEAVKKELEVEATYQKAMESIPLQPLLEETFGDKPFVKIQLEDTCQDPKKSL
jgi:hypothetical protein